MAKNYPVWFMEGNSQMQLDGASRMVHDGQGHNLYQYSDGKLLALSGKGSMNVGEDGRILDSTGNQVGFITDYALFRKSISRSASASAKKPDAGKKTESAKKPESPGKPAAKKTPARSSGGQAASPASGRADAGQRSASGTAASGTARPGAKAAGEPKKKSHAWLFILIIIGIVYYMSQNQGKPAGQETARVHDNLKAAAVSLRKGLVNHEDEITVKYRASVNPANRFTEAQDVFIEATKHTGNPNEGHQLASNAYYSRGEMTYSAEKDKNGYIISITYPMIYFTTKAQEEQLRPRIRSIVSGLGLNGKSDYEKVRAIYNWICSHVTYDFAHLDDDSYTLQFTAYNAVMTGTAVCNGYAQLFYQMALTAGLDARIMLNDDHAWNLVRVDGKYYYCDTTWDRGLPESRYQFFLKGRWDFQLHEPDLVKPAINVGNHLKFSDMDVDMALEAYRR